MNRILVVYETNEGQTQKIAGDIGATLRADGFEVDVVRAGERNPNPASYQGVIVAASLRAGRYQKPVVRWLRQHVGELNQMPGTAFVSVCLAIANRNEGARQHALAIPQQFADSINWHPATIKVVAGALRYSQYNFFIRWMMKRIAAAAGGDTDTTRDYEYTDWNDLRMFARQFGRRWHAAAA